MKTFWAVFLAIALCLALRSSVEAQASNSFALAASGTTPAIACGGASTATIVWQSGSGQIVAQVSGDSFNTSTVTLPSIGTVSSTGTYTGGMAGYTSFRLNVTVSAGVVKGLYYCTTQLARGAPVSNTLAVANSPSPAATTPCCTPLPNYISPYNWNSTHLAFQTFLNGACTAGCFPFSSPNPNQVWDIDNINPIYVSETNTSGQNTSFGAGPFARTEQSLVKLDGIQNGFGDETNLRCYSLAMTTGLTQPLNASQFTQSSSEKCVVATLYAIAPYHFIEGSEYDLNDLGNPTEEVGYVVNLVRGVAPSPAATSGATSGPAVEGFASQALNSTFPADAAFVARGNFNEGLDLAAMVTGTTAIAIPKNTNICLGATSFDATSLNTTCGTTYITFDGTSYKLFVGGVNMLSVTASGTFLGTGNANRVKINARGYAAEVMPQASPTQNPVEITGTCSNVAITGTTCTFPNAFAFGANDFLCDEPVAWATTSPMPMAISSPTTTSIKITAATATVTTAAYHCIGHV